MALVPSSPASLPNSLSTPQIATLSSIGSKDTGISNSTELQYDLVPEFRVLESSADQESENRSDTCEIQESESEDDYGRLVQVHQQYQAACENRDEQSRCRPELSSDCRSNEPIGRNAEGDFYCNSMIPGIPGLITYREWRLRTSASSTQRYHDSESSKYGRSYVYGGPEDPFVRNQDTVIDDLNQQQEPQQRGPLPPPEEIPEGPEGRRMLEERYGLSSMHSDYESARREAMERLDASMRFPVERTWRERPENITGTAEWYEKEKTKRRGLVGKRVWKL